MLFDVRLKWTGHTNGSLTTKAAPGELGVGLPAEFGGTEMQWTPEHYFLNAISGCFMTTFLALSKKMNFEFADFNCEVVGQIEIVDGRYKFTKIALFPKVYIVDETTREKAEKAMEKTHKYCLITNSVNAEVVYHGKVFVIPDKKLPVVNANS